VATAIDKNGYNVIGETLSRYLYNTISDLPAEKNQANTAKEC
jgi:hypothetical protein